MFNLRGDMGVGVVFQPLAEEVREAAQNLNGDLLELFFFLRNKTAKMKGATNLHLLQFVRH